MAIDKDPLNFIVCGIGGQGNVLASQIIGRVFVKEGYLITADDVYGASQRGGAVSTFFRVSKKSLWSPIMPRGSADLILAFEPLEALRNLVQFGNKETIVIANTYPIAPMSVMRGAADYPTIEKLRELFSDLSQKSFLIDATGILSQLGVRYLSTFMVGALVGTNILPLSREGAENTLSESFRGEILKLNTKSFNLGVESIAQVTSA